MHQRGRPCGHTSRRAPDRGRQRRVPGRPVFFAAWTSPNDGAVKVANTSGCTETVSGTSFIPPAAPAISTCHTTPLYSRLRDGEPAARRFPHRTYVIPSGSAEEA